MTYNKLTTAAIAVLAVTAIATAAATLHSEQTPVSGEGSATLGGPGGPESGSDSGLVGSESVATGGTPSELLRTLLRYSLLLVAVFVPVGAYLLYRVYGLRGSSVAVLVVVFLVISSAVFLLSGSLTPKNVDQSKNGGLFDGNTYSLPGGGATSGTEATPILRNTPVILILGIGLAVVIGAVVVARSKGGDAEESPSEPVESNEIASLDRTAGRAATRMENTTEPINELFRAWKDMTTYLDVERPRSSTPQEFATAAVEAGMDRGDVAELTELFRHARYGDTPVTREREKRAISALRRIETTYDRKMGRDDSGKIDD